MFKKFILSLIVFTIYSIGTINAQCSEVIFTMESAIFANESSWQVIDINNQEVVMTGDGYTSNTISEEIACLNPGCYTLVLIDSFGDGWNGSILTLSGEGVATESYTIEDGDGAVFGFGVYTDDCQLTILGCTDSNAVNFNPIATQDDGSCTYPLENDMCSGAVSIACGDVVGGSTIGFTADDMDACGTSISAPGVWYVFEGVDETVTFGTCTADYDSKISVFSSNDDCTTLTCVDGDDDSCTGLTSEVVINAEPGTNYYVLVHGFGSAEGNFELTATCGIVDVFGCTDAEATNYNPAANSDDGSCEYACEDGQILANLYVCTFSNANEVAIEIVDEDGNIVFEQADFTGQAIMNTEICLEEGMCYTVNMINTVNTGWYNGYYWININGVQVSTGFPADDENFATAQFSTNGPCGELMLGCTDEFACNFDSTANWSDQSCTYPGCMDSTALNFNPNAGCDDDSCEYPEPCFDNLISLDIIMDNFTSEASWDIIDADANIVASGSGSTLSPGLNNLFVCLEDGCYTMLLHDSFGDGWGFGSSIETPGFVTVTTPSGVFNYNFDNGDEAAFGFGVNAEDCEISIPGCTDSTALNFDQNATEDDGSCEYPCENVAATLYVCTFANGNEVSIEILDDEGNVVFAQDDFSNNQIMNTELCLEDGICYTVNMYNTVNTGWYGGYFWVNVNGIQVATGFPADDEDFATVDFSTFGVCGDAVLGCTDNSACNFDSLATWNDNYCTYPGCMDSAAYNFDPSAGCDDGSCIYIETPINDECANAIAMNCGETVDGSTVGAFVDVVNYCGTSVSAPGVWYTINGNYETITMSTCGQADFDTKISVFRGEECDSLICVGGNDDVSGCSGFTSEISFFGDLGETYYVLVHGFGTGEGTFGLTAECTDDEQSFGCTDSLALNFDPTATIDDGSCEYFLGDCESLFAIYDIINEQDLVIIVNLSDGTDLSYFWDFGDGTTSTEEFPIHFYEEDGTYTVCLTVSSEECEDVFCVDVAYEGAGDIIDGSEIEANTNNGFSINIINENQVSVEENLLVDQGFTMYPNPTADQLTLAFDKQVNSEFSFQVFDLSGRLMLSQDALMNNKTTTIDVASLSNGIYFLSITNEFGVVTKRFEVTK